MIYLSFFAAVIPALFYLYWLRRSDKYDKEPVSLYLKNFAWGAFGAVIFTLFGSALFNSVLESYILSETLLDLAGGVLVAPIVEEFMKGIFLFSTITRKEFDNLTDGLVYGGAIGFGFGMTENFLYFISNSDSVGGWIFIVLMRTMFSCVMHFICTATFGAFLGYIKFKPLKYKLTLPFVGYFIAVVIHATWNSALSIDGNEFYGIIFMIVAMILFKLLFKHSISLEAKLIKQELTEEVELGHLPRNLVQLALKEQDTSELSLNFKEGEELVNSAVRLAFRKGQFRNSTGFNKKYYAQEINYYRKVIPEIIGVQRTD